MNANGVSADLAAGGSAFLAIYSVGIIALLILQIVANWKIFEKAGEQGWKSLIPVYAEYILYKIAWDTKPFWILIGLSVLTIFLSAIPVAGMVFGFIISILLIIIEVLCYVKLAKAFGHGRGFALGLILLSPIFLMILGFENSEYLGPQE